MYPNMMPNDVTRLDAASATTGAETPSSASMTASRARPHTASTAAPATNDAARVSVRDARPYAHAAATPPTVDTNRSAA